MRPPHPLWLASLAWVAFIVIALAAESRLHEMGHGTFALAVDLAGIWVALALGVAAYARFVHSKGTHR